MTILVLKVIPMLLAFCAILNMLFDFFGMDSGIFSVIGGISILPLLFLYLASYTFCFCVYHRMFLHYVLACLYDAGASDSILEQAEDLMLSCKYNCGFTYSDQRRRRAVVLIGPASSGDEFLDTFVHETRHLADAIAEGLGIYLNSEHPAYISGDTARSLAGIICELGCPKCHDKRR